MLRHAAAQSWRAGDPFSLGVASGAPRPDGFVLWTRLAPDPLSTDPETPGGMSGGDVTVAYEIATDAAMRNIVRRGEATAEQAFAYSVHLDVAGLQPGRPYWYRFTSGDAASRGRPRRHAAGAGTPLDRLRFGFVSCSNYEHGYFSAYRHLADENPDVVLFLGDYIYEYIEERRPTVRRHSDGIEAATLPTYRNRYAQYRLDPDLQRLHAEVPALVTWDDHEVQNDYADKWSQFFDDPALFLLRRAAAYRAFYEHMPVRPILSRPEGPVMRVYDRFTLRRPDRNFDDRRPAIPFARSLLRAAEQGRRPSRKRRQPARNGATPGRTMMGFAQEAWLYATSRPLQGAMESDRAGRADGAVSASSRTANSPSRPTTGTAIRPTARGCSSASTTRRCPTRSWSAATSIRSSPTTCSSISTIPRRRWWRRNSSAPRSRPTGRPTT